MNKIFKVFKGQVKSINTDDFAIDVVVSTATIDRDKEKINTEAFKKRLKFYKDHPVLLSSHRYDDLRKQIGEAQNIKVTDEGLEAKFKYYVGEGNPEADWAWVLAQKNIAGFSIGFMPFGFEDKDLEKDGYRREYTDVELVEISQVLVPSNREAVQARRNYVTNLNDIEKDLLEVAIKSFETGELRELVTKPEETDDYIRIPIHDSDNYGGIKTIALSADEGIKALAGKLKSGEDKSMHIITVLFEKDKDWDMEKAKKWVADHKDELKALVEEIIKRQETEFAQKILDIIGLNVKFITEKIIADATFLKFLEGVAKRPDTSLDKDTILEMVKSALQKENT